MLRREGANKFCFFGILRKKPQAYPKKDVLAVFRLRLFFFTALYYSFIFKKRYNNSPGSNMGPDNASDGRIADFFQVTLPDMAAVLNIF